MGKHFIPIPEYLTALQDITYTDTADGKEKRALWDVVKNNGCAFFVLTDNLKDEDGHEFCVSQDGSVYFEDHLMLVPTMHCKECGQRMFVDEIPVSLDWLTPCVSYNLERIYRCPCNSDWEYSSIHGWKHSEEKYV